MIYIEKQKELELENERLRKNLDSMKIRVSTMGFQMSKQDTAIRKMINNRSQCPEDEGEIRLFTRL